MVVLAITISLGKERRGRDFLNRSDDEELERAVKVQARAQTSPQPSS